MKIIEPLVTDTYMMPTKAYFGRGAVKELPFLINSHNVKKFLLIAGEHFLISPKNKKLLDTLKQTNKVEVYTQNIKKSDFETINQLIHFVKDKKYDGIIGIGGGAILDSAKVAAVISINGGIAEDYVINNTKVLKNRGIFFIAVPTTSGTGSEVAPWAVIWGDKKYSLSSREFMFPDIALVDPALTDDCPPYVTATSGIDALCQAIECYWNVKHNPTSDQYALEAIEVIISSLEKAVNNPDHKSRDKMAWGSLIDGLAFSQTGTTLCHSVSYPITSHWDITHGQATSIVLPLFIEYLFPVLSKERRLEILKAIDAKDEKDTAQKVRKLIESIGLKLKLSELGIPKEGIDIIIKEGFDPTRAKNAPKIPTPYQLKQMLESIF